MPPDHVLQELANGAVFHRSPPDDRIAAGAEQQPDGHHRQIVVHFGGDDLFSNDLYGVLFNPHQLGNARSVDVHVQQPHPLSGLGQRRGQIGGNGALAHAAFARKDQQLVTDLRHPVPEHLLLSLLLRLVGHW